MKNLEKTILNNLITNNEYARKVLPFLKSDYFQDKNEQIIFEEIQKFSIKYSKLPTSTSLQVELDNRKDLNEQQFKDITSIVDSFQSEEVDGQWLLDTTEKFCKDKAVYNAVVDGISIIEGRDKKRKPDALPSLLTNALAVSFDNRVGHDYLTDAEDRYDYYHKKEDRIPFDLDFFNKITKGGLPQKTLNIALAGTGVGKSLFMCHMAANCLNQGRNVLYITLEMAEERIAERIDANLMNVSMEDLQDLPKNMYQDKMERIASKTQGKLIIKEYPTASAHCNHFRALIQELAIKKSFKADIIFVDYLNICASSRFRGGSNVNSYTMIKAIAEELRGLAVENNLPIVSATQTTRSGYVSTDIGLEDTSESFGLPATADFMFALISTEEMDELNQITVKQLKNRYNDPTVNRRFVLGIDRSKMKLYDVELSAQNDLVNSGQEAEDIPVFDKSQGARYEKFGKFKV
jgi:archaellum biogenesis ATPase FlaH|tara:strand:+ start:26484 stop:27872 length:1389 start_codon:yes stop_codon:yes gene_type:complete